MSDYAFRCLHVVENIQLPYFFIGVLKGTIPVSQMVLSALGVQLVMSAQILRVILLCALKGPMHWMVKQAAVSVQWDSVAYQLMSYPLLVLKDGILLRGIFLALLVLLGTIAPLLLLVPHLFGVLMDTMLI